MIKIVTLLMASLLTFSWAGSALAQAEFAFERLPVMQTAPDFYGVDPTTGTFPTSSALELGVPGSGNLRSRTSFNGRKVTSSLSVYLEDETYTPWDTAYTHWGGPDERHIKVHLGGRDVLFTCKNVPTPQEPQDFSEVVCTQDVKVDGSRLERHPTSGDYTFTDKLGTVYKFFPLIVDPYLVPCSSWDTGCNAALYKAYAFASEVVFPAGEKITYEPLATFNQSVEPRTLTFSVRSNLGYRIEFRRHLPAGQTYNPSSVPGAAWLIFRLWTPEEKSLYRGTELLQRITASRVDRANEFDLIETDDLGREYQATYEITRRAGCTELVSSIETRLPIQVRSPGGVVTSLTYARVGSGPTPNYLLWRPDGSVPVESLSRGPYTWTYHDAVGGSLKTREVRFQGAPGRLVEYRTLTAYNYGANENANCPLNVVGTRVYGRRDELQRRSEYDYTTGSTVDAKGHPNLSQLPEGDGYDYNYDQRGNVTEVWRLPKPQDSGSKVLIFKAEYPADCVHRKTCNKPTWVQDANGVIGGYRTDYTYYHTHGGIDTITLPELDGTRPQTRYLYEARNTGDGIIYRQESTSECIRGSSCAGTANEAKTVTTYWSNTFLPATRTARSGDSSTLSKVSFVYDNAGRVTRTTDPLNQQTHHFYDVGGRVIGQIGPDPDGSGPLPRLAQRTSYDDDDRVTRLESGTATGTSRVALTAMVVTGQVDNVYDQLGRKVVTTASAAGSTLALTQYSYDAWNRPVCSAVRLNLTLNLAALPDPCTPTLSSDGYDRVTKNFYDAAGQLKAVWAAVGTPLEQVHTQYDYTLNGKPWFIVDANQNLTEFDYDEFDRLATTYFPVKLTASRSASSADFEAYDYDANDNLNWFRKRNGSVFTYQYNKLNLLKVKQVPSRTGLSPAHSRSVFYTYDLRGFPEKTLFDSATGQGIEQEYDALGRPRFSKYTLDGTNRTLTYEYNAKLRTAVTHPDSQRFAYDYDFVDRLKTITHAAAGTLAGFAYDAQGHLDVLSGGVNSSHDFDGAGRPVSLTHDLAGTAHDNTYSYGYNAASQVERITASNGNFAPDASPRNETSEVNGLNQYTTVAGVTHTYDANGNLTSDGDTNYVYDQENRLVRATTSAGVLKLEISYDPHGRPYKLQSPSGSTAFLYDGDALVAEYNASTNALTHRYVHSGADSPVAWFAGGAVTQTARRHVRANHQGSIVAVTDAAGNGLYVPRYDTWGSPVGTHPMRFGYTGQVWLPELGLWHYKARVYSPRLGRFLQTDPVGYADQMNLYAYVGNDPASRSDPTGMETDYDLDPIVIEGQRKHGLDDEWGPAPDLSNTASAHAPQPAVGNLLGQPTFHIEDTSETFQTGLEIVLAVSPMPTPGKAAVLGRLLIRLKAAKAARGIKIGPRWGARAITDAACRNGCERVAAQIQKHIGGNIKRILPADARATNLGAYRGQNLGWGHHEVVVKDGRVFDAFTGHQGMPINDYKSLWDYADAINFGF